MFASLLSEVKIIFILREPIDRLRSFFSFAQNNIGIIPPSIDINEYINDLRLIECGSSLPDYLDGRIIAQSAILHGCYDRYLSDWYDRLGADRISVYLFEDLQSNPLSFMKKLSYELGIDPDFYYDFQFDISNETLNIRNNLINGYFRKFRRLLRNHSDSFYYGFCKQIYKNTLSSPLVEKPSLSEESIKYLNSIFVPSNAQLRILSGLSLSSWETDLSDLDFLVIGAQKSATTTLWKILADHPMIKVPKSKEAPFFSRKNFNPEQFPPLSPKIFLTEMIILS